MSDARRDELISQCRRVFEAKTGLAGVPEHDGKARVCEATRPLNEASDEELLAEIERRKL